MKPFFIGNHNCARCGGDDPNCYVCNVPDRDDAPESIEDEILEPEPEPDYTDHEFYD